MTTIVFALPLGYFLTSQVIHRKEVFGAAVVVLGLAVFTVVGQAADGRDNAPAGEWAVAVTVFSAIAVGLIVARWPRNARPEGGALRGECRRPLRALGVAVQADGGDPRRQGLGDGPRRAGSSTPSRIAGILAFVVQQVSLSTGKLAASVATVSVCNPLVSIVIGTLLLDERLAEPTWHKVVAYAGLGCALVGAAAISMATEEREATEDADSSAEAPRRACRARDLARRLAA